MAVDNGHVKEGKHQEVDDNQEWDQGNEVRAKDIEDSKAFRGNVEALVGYLVEVYIGA